MKTKIFIISLLATILCLSGCKKDNPLNSWQGSLSARAKVVDKYGNNLLKDVQNGRDRDTNIEGSSIEVWDTQQDTVISKDWGGFQKIRIAGVDYLHCRISVVDPKICPPSVTFKVKCPAVFGDDNIHLIISKFEYPYIGFDGWSKKWVGCSIDGVNYPITNVVPSDYSYVTLVIDKQ